LKRDNRGATLIEILIAIAILAICVVPLFKSMILSIQTNVKARTLLSATTAAESAMEDMKADGMEQFLEKNGGNSEIEDIAELKENNKVAGYTFTYPNYEIDGKKFKLEVEAKPYQNTDKNAVDYNSEQVADLYRMDLRTDGIYVQEAKTVENDFIQLAGEGTFEPSQKDTVLNNLSTNWNYFITTSEDAVQDINIQNIQQTITYEYGSTLLGEHDMLLYDSTHFDKNLKNLYICFIPNKSNTITITNKSDYPVNVYLVKQGDMKAVVTVNLIGSKLINNLGEEKDPEFTKGVRLRTNFDTDDEITYKYTCAGITTTLSAEQLSENFGLKGLSGASVQTRLYDITIKASKDGKEITTLSGTITR